jgi:hypothetical protein
MHYFFPLELEFFEEFDFLTGFAAQALDEA